MFLLKVRLNINELADFMGYLNTQTDKQKEDCNFGDLADMISGATDGQIQSGMGHDPEYWVDGTYNGVKCALAAEAFAGMTCATLTNPKSHALIKKYLPKSYSIYEEMLKEATK